jgi:hypothetical protein
MGVVLVVVMPVAVLLGWAALIDWRRRRRRRLRAEDEDVGAALRAHSSAEGTRHHPTVGGV